MAEKAKFPKTYNITNYLKVLNQFVKNLENACFSNQNKSSRKNKRVNKMAQSIDITPSVTRMMKRQMRRTHMSNYSKVENQSNFENTFFEVDKSGIKNDPITAYYKGENMSFDGGNLTDKFRYRDNSAHSDSIEKIRYLFKNSLFKTLI